jgi:hypothetical protein
MNINLNYQRVKNNLPFLRPYWFKDQMVGLLSFKYFRPSLRLYDWYRSRGKFNVANISIDTSMIKSKLIVIYRISPYPNGKSPIFSKNKYALVKFCLDSFIKAFSQIKPYVIFVLDSCPLEYQTLINSYSGIKSEIIELDKAGNKGTWYAQIDIAKLLNSESYVYFAEDDYYYLPNAGKRLMKALEKYDFVTLCDHANYYEKPMVNKRKIIELIDDYHWKSCESSCLTFGTKVNLVKKYENLFKKYGTFDHPLWMEIGEKRHLIFGPLPSLCTHLVKGQLAPGIDWKSIWKKRNK